MADVPIYEPRIAVEAPGVPQSRVQPMDPSISSAGVFEAAAGIGKSVSEIGARVEQHMVMQEKLRAQQDDYATAEAFKSELQNRLSDPKNGIIVQNQGVNAINAVPAFDALIHGTPASPGKPGTPPLREQFMKDKSPYEQARVSRLIASTESMFRGKLINYALAQKEQADQQITEAHFDSEKKDAALVTPTAVDDPKTGKLIPAIQLKENSVRDSVMNDVNLRLKGTPPEKLKQIAQDHVDEVAKIAIQANVGKSWEDAQKILNASSASPEAKVALQNTVNGARVDQYTEALAKSVTTSPELRSPDGQIDEGKAISYVNGQIAAQEKSGTPLPPGHADAIMGKIQSQIAIQNKAVSQHQQLVLAKASNDIWAAQKSGMNPNDAYNKFIKQGQFDNGIERAKAEDVFTKVYEKDPSALDTVWAHMSATQKETIAQIEGRKDFQDKFSYPDDKKAFLNSFKERILEGRVQSPDAINKLYQEQIKDAATGAPRFLGFGHQRKPQYEIDETLLKNQPVVKAVGGLASAATLAQALGGLDKLAPDTNESKAVMLLAKYGKPITADTISTVITKHPDLLK